MYVSTFLIIFILIWYIFEHLIHVCLRLCGLCPFWKTIVLGMKVTHALQMNKIKQEVFKYKYGEFPVKLCKWEQVQVQPIVGIPEKQ